MKHLIINTKTKKYPVVFYNSFDHLLEEINNLSINFSKIIIMTDDNVGPLYAKEIEKLLKQSYLEVYTCTFAHGETNKHLGSISDAYSFMLSKNIDRKSLVLALGGGVVGDMAGFAAATYMRGIRFIQIPTTLLSQVDSSVGGKTGVDYKGYKNIIGSFYQPELVYINTRTLHTLPKKEFSSGMAEVIKHALIMDENYLNEINQLFSNITSLEDHTISTLIYKSCTIKNRIVSEDETEEGKRALLNFGHTIGHAIERMKNFELLHGECVAIGMLASLYISVELGYIKEDLVLTIQEILEKYHLPTFVEGLDPEDVYLEMFHDKKTVNHTMNFVLIDQIGSSFITDKANKEIAIRAIGNVIKR